MERVECVVCSVSVDYLLSIVDCHTGEVLEVGIVDHSTEFDVGAWGGSQWADVDGHFDLVEW